MGLGHNGYGLGVRFSDLGNNGCGQVAVVAICFDLSLSHDGYGFGGCYDSGFIGFCFDIVVCHQQCVRDRRNCF